MELGTTDRSSMSKWCICGVCVALVDTIKLDNTRLRSRNNWSDRNTHRVCLFLIFNRYHHLPSCLHPNDGTDTSADRNMRSYSPMSFKPQKYEPEKIIQAWWRCMLAVRAAKKPLRKIFEGDVTGLTGLRCLVLMGVDDEILGTWARALIRLGPEAILAQALEKHTTSWLVLLRKAAWLLFLSLAHAPESPNAALYLDALMVLLSHKHAVATSGAPGSAFCQAITAYLMERRFYDLLKRSVLKLSIQNSTNLPPFLSLCMLPLSTYQENSPQFNEIYANIVGYILSLPLFRNRLQLDNPSPLILYFLLTDSDKLVTLSESINFCLSDFCSVNLVANIFAFVSMRYQILSTPAIASYLQLSVKLFNRFNVYPLCSSSSLYPSRESESQTNSVDNDSDFSDGHKDDDIERLLSRDRRVYDRFPMKINDETMKWIKKIATPQHITNLINVTQSQAILLPHLVEYLFTVTATWPSSQQEIQDIVLASPCGNLVGDLYREIVRHSPLGQEEDAMNVYDPKTAVYWPPIIFLTDLYSQALHTMDDKEFFGQAPGSRGRNPLTLEEVASFSVQLLNIVFTLDWRYSDYSDMPKGRHSEYISSDVYCSWTALKEKLMQCLLRIRARDSRRPFVLVGHWLLRSQFDKVDTFIDAALIREQGSSWVDTETIFDITIHQWNFARPWVAILKNIPFALPFETRVSIFQHFIATDRVLHSSTERLDAMGHDQRLRVKIRRGVVTQDGFERLGEIDLRAPLEIAMIDQFGQEEEGFDDRGHFKEFFTLFCPQVFDLHRGLWWRNMRGELYPIWHGYEIEAYTLDWYWFIGRMVGKAIYDGILVDTPFATSFLSKCLHRKSHFDDLSLIDPDLYHRLLSLKHLNENTEPRLSYFTVTIKESGVSKIVELIQNGRDIAVTRENRLRYIDLATRFRLNVQIKQQSEVFLEGLSHSIQPKWLNMFDQQELQILIGGANVPIDLNDLRRHTTYGGIYHNSHETIMAFWRVVNSFHRWQKHTLLQFVTNCSRPPALGFKDLVPNFSIRDGGSDENHLPTSSRCINLLKLPTYKSDGQLREMLLQAITSRAGFDSS
ncbi:hypothetical protein GALMADRAFT_879854 [Galerina marginata CBS 339.88]|uniref:HECT-type E3 ubiquitin transferase n=1 Tax=Galerina marginata (strain CBS 339.88) TaxID=685588 RepID=A0A067SI73_GALM3|nr:hypothetical protein GALMADRAFT_879854 [Galerina marginata CBS 339.88]